MLKVSYIVVMGAAVSIEGVPSGALKRRVNSALKLSQKFTHSVFLVTGGIGKNKTTSEAEVMKKLLIESGIADSNIIIEDQSTDTLSSIYYCTSILNTKNNCLDVYVCSDLYHIARCRWLFSILGIHTLPANVINGLKANGLFKWIYFYFREAVAIVPDTFLAYIHKAGIRKIR